MVLKATHTFNPVITLCVYVCEHVVCPGIATQPSVNPPIRARGVGGGGGVVIHFSQMQIVVARLRRSSERIKASGLPPPPPIYLFNHPNLSTTITHHPLPAAPMCCSIPRAPLTPSYFPPLGKFPISEVCWLLGDEVEGRLR